MFNLWSEKTLSENFLLNKFGPSSTDIALNSSKSIFSKSAMFVIVLKTSLSKNISSLSRGNIYCHLAERDALFLEYAIKIQGSIP